MASTHDLLHIALGRGAASLQGGLDMAEADTHPPSHSPWLMGVRVQRVFHTPELPWGQAERGTPPANAPCLASPPGLSRFTHSLTSFPWEHSVHQFVALDTLAPGLLLGETHLAALSQEPTLSPN